MDNILRLVDEDEKNQSLPPPPSPPPLQVTCDTPTSPPPLTLTQQSATQLLFHFSKTFISVMESTIYKSSSSSSSNASDDEYFDNFSSSPYSSSSHFDPSHPVPLSDEDFAFEKYFPSESKEFLRTLFTTLSFDIFTSYEYQLVMLVREKRKIAEIAEDIVHRILDNFKESQRGCNPEFIRPEITPAFLTQLALQHTEPEGITYNSEWSAVEVLENPGILIPSDVPSSNPGTFYQSDWQKNFIGVKKKIGSKYGFRLKFSFETELSILRNFEKVPLSSVYPLYLRYSYVLTPALLESTRMQIVKEIETEEKMKKFGILNRPELQMKDKVKEFQIKLQIQKQEEDRNSDKVMKQISRGSEQDNNARLKDRLTRLEERGVIKADEVEKVKVGLLRSNYNVRFEVKESGEWGWGGGQGDERAFGGKK